MSDNAIPRNPLIEHSFINFSSPQFQKKALIALAVTSLVMIVVGSMGLGGVGFLAALAIPMAVHFIAVIGGAGAFTLSFVGIRKLFHQNINKNLELEIDQKLQAATPQEKLKTSLISYELFYPNHLSACDSDLNMSLKSHELFYNLNGSYSSNFYINKSLKNCLNSIKSRKIKNQLDLELWKLMALKIRLNNMKDITKNALGLNLQEAVKSNFEFLHDEIIKTLDNTKNEEDNIIKNFKLTVKQVKKLNKKELKKIFQEVQRTPGEIRIEYILSKKQDINSLTPLLNELRKKLERDNLQ